MQVGAFFLKNYYPILQQQPELVHQFYTELSSMVRFDGTATESATGMVVLLANLSHFPFFLDKYRSIFYLVHAISNINLPLLKKMWAYYHGIIFSDLWQYAMLQVYVLLMTRYLGMQKKTSSNVQFSYLKQVHYLSTTKYWFCAKYHHIYRHNLKYFLFFFMFKITKCGNLIKTDNQICVC